jgi:hypothetical protein
MEKTDNSFKELELESHRIEATYLENGDLQINVFQKCECIDRLIVKKSNLYKKQVRLRLKNKI